MPRSGTQAMRPGATDATRVPAGVFTFVVVVDPDVEPGWEVVVVALVLDVDGLTTGTVDGLDFPPSRPRPAARPAPARPTPATAAAKTPWSVNVLRSMSPTAGTDGGLGSWRRYGHGAGSHGAPAIERHVPAS